MYEELLIDRGIGPDDPVPADLASPRQAGYELLRDYEVRELAEPATGAPKGRTSGGTVLRAVLLSIPALPVALPLALVLALLFFVVAVTAAAVVFALGVAVAALTLAPLLTLIDLGLGGQLTAAEGLFLVGLTLIAAALTVFLILGVRRTAQWIRRATVRRLPGFSGQIETRTEVIRTEAPVTELVADLDRTDLTVRVGDVDQAELHYPVPVHAKDRQVYPFRQTQIGGTLTLADRRTSRLPMRMGSAFGTRSDARYSAELILPEGSVLDRMELRSAMGGSPWTASPRPKDR